MKKLLPFLVALAIIQPASAQMPKVDMQPIAPPAQPNAIPLYASGTLPPAPVPESWTRTTVDFSDGTHLVGRATRNVSVPTLTPVLPDPVA